MIIYDEEKEDEGPTDALSLGSKTKTLRFVTQETRGNLIQDILGHPELSPSFDELAYVNPSKSRATLREHLDKLESAGIIKKVDLPERSQSRDKPRTFYTLTEPGISFLHTHNLFIDEFEQIQEDYKSVKKSEQIQAKEEAIRPAKAKETRELINQYVSDQS
jgi:DNA-binding HxlR family transcriptional regulator